MGEHETWFHLIPGVRNLEHTVSHALGKGWFYGEEIHGLPHVIMGLFVVALCIFLGVRYKAALAASGDGGVVPARTFGLRAVVEIIAEGTLGVIAGVMGEKAAKQFLPLIGTMAFFIFFANIMGLVPGFQPATSAPQTTAACAVIIFLATHYYGLKVNGMNHIKHLMGPVWWLAPLMFVIEIISHLARPLSLALRLMGNMIGDHKVLALFIGMTYLFVPIPMLLLGMIVCTVQTLVFCMLSVVYIGLAIEEQHHDEHEPAH